MRASEIYNGQTRKEFVKNYTRVKDIISKSDGNVDKEKSLAARQAKVITNEHKAINRAMAARELGNDVIFGVFFEKAYNLGSVGTQEYRDYLLEKLLEE